MSEVDAESTDSATKVEELNITATVSKEVEHEPLSPEKNLKIVPCGNCGKECTQICANCGKEGYCSVLCQKARRSKHKDDCFPAKEEIGDGFRARGTGPMSFWIATRDIKEGEKIFTDYPLMVGPAEERGGPGAHVCVGCHEILLNFAVDSDPRKCCHCRWPICGPECSGTQRHMKECGTLCWMRDHSCSFEFFARLADTTATGLRLYRLIRYIRLFVLKKSEPTKWARFQNLPLPALALNRVSGSDQFDSEFWKIACGLDELTSEMMNRLVETEGYHHKPSYNTYTRTNKAERVIYDKETRMDISCMENCYVWPIHPSESKKKNPHGIMVIAGKPIQKGQRLTMSFYPVHQWDGTKRRRQLQMKNPLKGADPNLGFICKCPRCVDPTELGTYVSAVKCTKCRKGYLLPLNPLDDNSKWKCDSQECSTILPGSVVDKIVDKIQKEANGLENIPIEVPGAPHYKIAEFLAVKYTIEKFVEKYGKELHPHHYILFNVQGLSRIIHTTMLHKTISADKEPQAMEVQRYEINRLRTLAGIFMAVGSKLFPPFSSRLMDGHFYAGMSDFLSAQQAVIDGGELDTVLNFLKKGLSHKRSLEDFKSKKGCPLMRDDKEDEHYDSLLAEGYNNAIELCSSHPKYCGIPYKIFDFVQNLSGAEEVEVEGSGKN